MGTRLIPPEGLTICDVCGFTLYHPILGLGATTLSLYDDVRFPGRCILTLGTPHEHNHWPTLEDMGPGNVQAFMEELLPVSRALGRVTGAKRVNVAFLMNTVEHVHAHLIPRTGLDPRPGKSPWNHPRPASPMHRQCRNQVMEKIRIEVSREFPHIELTRFRVDPRLSAKS